MQGMKESKISDYISRTRVSTNEDKLKKPARNWFLVYEQKNFLLRQSLS